jgi:hypothetical protein
MEKLNAIQKSNKRTWADLPIPSQTLRNLSFKQIHSKGYFIDRVFCSEKKRLRRSIRQHPPRIEKIERAVGNFLGGFRSPTNMALKYESSTRLSEIKK